MSCQNIERQSFSVDTLVVGGGPAGLSAAERAARSGSVLVVHRDKEIGRPVRTSGGTWLRELHRLRLPEHVCNPIDELVFVGPTRTARIAFQTDKPAVADVTRLYQHLAEQATKAGAHILCGARFLHAQPEANDFVACLISVDGREAEVKARFVIDASGWRRDVVASLGLTNRPKRMGLGIEYEFEDLSAERSKAALMVGNGLAPSGYGWIFPKPGNSVCIGVGIIAPDASAPLAKLLEQLLSTNLLNQLGFRIGRLLERHAGIVPADAPVSTVVHNRILTVGDAAGQALPLLGEGIRFAVEFGRTAGDAVAKALENPSHWREYLHAYESHWQKQHYKRFLLAYRANKRLSAYTDRDWDEKTRLLSLMNGDETARLLRMELTAADALRIFTRSPVTAGTMFFGTKIRRLGSLWRSRLRKILFPLQPRQ